MARIGDEDRTLLAAGLPLLQTARLGNGQVMQYRAAGPADAEPVILLHGLGSHAAGWRGLFAALADRWRLIAWDAPGFGGSDPLSGDAPTADAYVQQLLALADSLGVARFHLVGSSWGAMIAAAAAAHSQRIAGLVLLVPNLGLGGLPAAERAAALAMFSAPDLVLTAKPADFAAMLTAPDAPEEVLGLARTLKDQTTARGYAQAVQMMGATDTLALAPAIRQPTLVLGGSADKLAPADQHGRPIANAIAGAKFQLLDGVGHLLKLEAPAAVSDLIDQHLSTAGASR